MSSATATNGKPQRKQLADQLDRLDSIIDTLAEGLNQAVADAAREGTRVAVKEIVVELMTNPELRALIAPPAPMTAPVQDTTNPPAPTKSVWSRVKSAAATSGAAAVGAAERAKAATHRRIAAASDTVAAVAQATGEALPMRRVLVVGVAAGVLVGAACVLAPHAVAAVVGGAGAAVTAVGAQVGQWLARAARRVGLLS